jgi:hypothetical protein
MDPHPHSNPWDTLHNFVQFDQRIADLILEDGVSNAVKYGAKDSPILFKCYTAPSHSLSSSNLLRRATPKPGQRSLILEVHNKIPR